MYVLSTLGNASYQPNYYKYQCDKLSVPNQFLTRGQGRVSAATGISAAEEALPIRCVIDGCGTFFRLSSSFRSHVYRKHRNVIIPDSHDLTTDCMRTSDCADNDVDSNTDCDISTNAVDGSDETDIPSVESDIVKSLGLFCLKLKEKYGASETVVSNVLHVMKQVQTSHQQQILTELRKTGINITTNSEVAALLTKTSPTFDAYEASLDTSLKLFNFYADTMPLVLPLMQSTAVTEFCAVDCALDVYVPSNVTSTTSAWRSKRLSEYSQEDCTQWRT